MAESLRSISWNKAGLDHVLKSPPGEVGIYMSRLGGYVTRQAKVYAASRLQRRTGVYASSFHTTTLLVGNELRTRITNAAPYATYIENGTQPHIILPVRGRYLVFTSRSGTLVFARKVNHPGTRPYRILTDALRVGVRLARV